MQFYDATIEDILASSMDRAKHEAHDLECREASEAALAERDGDLCQADDGISVTNPSYAEYLAKHNPALLRKSSDTK